MMTKIKIGDLTLRPIVHSDAAQFAVLCNDETLAQNTSRVPFPYSIENAKQFVERAVDEFASGKEFRFAVCREDKIIACTGVMSGDAYCFELGYWVGAEDRGKGVATKAAAAVITFAFGRCGAEEISAGHFIDNPASGRVLAKLGFRPTGIVIKTMSIARGAEADTARFELRRDDFKNDSGISIED